MRMRIEGRVMVHRTDIAGGSADRQVLAVAACAAVHLNGSLIENDASPRTLPFQDSFRFQQEVLPPLDGSSIRPCQLSRTPDPV